MMRSCKAMAASEIVEIIDPACLQHDAGIAKLAQFFMLWLTMIAPEVTALSRNTMAPA